MTKATRRLEICATQYAVAAFGLVVLAFALLCEPPDAQAQAVHEVTIATPDIIAVEVRDPPFQPGHIEALSAPSDRQQGTWIKVGANWGMVVGRDRTHVRVSDTPPGTFVDHARLENASAYGEIGGGKVTSVFRKSVPYDSGIYPAPNGDTRTGASLKHYVYLQLSKPLREGTHTIRWPAGTLPDTRFNYADRATRAIALRVNQNGYGATDNGKIAYLSLWLPGGPAEGVVDFRSYGISTFHIIDEEGKRHFSSEISLRKAPTDPEPGNGLPSTLLEYPSAYQLPVPVTRIVSGPSLRIQAPNHGFRAGQRIWFDGFSGAENRFNGFATISTVTPDAFELAAPPSGNSAPNSLGPPVVLPVHKANRAGTYVFELDFSAWQPGANDQFRVHIPGLGISDAFEVGDDVWLRAGKISIGGLYNHRSGIALDGRFGFKRPIAFRPGQQMTVRLSEMPLSWTSNAVSTGFIPADQGGKKPWITNEVAPDTYWGGYMDAGDWDRRIDHLDVSYLLFDVYESFPEVLSATPLGIPKSSELLDRDLYGEIDELPDILHEAIWAVDFFRRLQLPDGSVRGGIESSGHPLLGVPSYLEHLAVFAYAPDHISSYRYAGVAAKFAGVLDRLDKPRIAEVYRTSALAAWRAAERMSSNGDAHYAEAKSIAASSGAFASVSWDIRARRLQQVSSEHRVAAAGSLFRLTGENEYRTAFEEAWVGKVDLGASFADGAWEYLQANQPSANSQLQERISGMIVASARSTAEAQDAAAYPGMKHPFAPLGWGQGLAPDYNQALMFIRAHRIDKDRKLLRTMQVASAQILGANQVGLSFTTGLGHRNIRHPLHEDHRAMGIKVPDGITSYGWASQSATAHEWIFGPFWSPLPIGGTRENAQNRKIAPNRFAMPLYEYLIEHPLLVMQQEYTVHQSIATTAAMWLYLHGVSRENAESLGRR